MNVSENTMLKLTLIVKLARETRVDYNDIAEMIQAAGYQLSPEQWEKLLAVYEPESV